MISGHPNLNALRPLAVLLVGLIGGLAAQAATLPLPYLLGSMAAVGAVAMAWRCAAPLPGVPEPMRRVCIAAIGAMIGATFTRDQLGAVPSVTVSLVMVLPFVLAAHAWGYLVMRRIGRFDRATAFYAAMPGGLVESATLGEAAGANVRLLSLQHFIRIVVVVITVPLIFSIIEGHPVGSSAGLTLGRGDWRLSDVAMIAALALIGIRLGLWLRMPAGHLMGPLVLAMSVHAIFGFETDAPGWLMQLAQLVVGTALGLRFAGTQAVDLGRAALLAGLAVAGMLVLAAGFMAALHPPTGLSRPALFLSYVPGGVTEVGLVALSLGISPAIVSLHHLVRITFTVLVAGLAARRFST